MADDMDFHSKLRLLDETSAQPAAATSTRTLGNHAGSDLMWASPADELGRSDPKGKGKAVENGSNGMSSKTPRECYLTNLPTELVDLILSFLLPVDLISAAATCRFLYEHAEAEHLWHALVQENVPGARVNTPYPCSSYKELYVAHDQRWFLPKYKIWFSDRDLVGRLIVVRYDPRRGCIEGYQLVAFSNQINPQPWAVNNQVTIHTFQPDVKLHLDKPILQLDANSLENIIMRTKRNPPIRVIRRGEEENGASGSTGSANQHQQPAQFNWPKSSRFQAETPMVLGSAADGMFSNFMHAKPLMPTFATHRASYPFPYGDVWPPPAIPAPHRVAGVTLQMVESGTGATPHRPTCRAEVSDNAFRIRSWVELGGGAAARDDNGVAPAATFWATAMLSLFSAPPSVSVHIGEEIATYATLDPELYTPTEYKPWRGIWVGDYSIHGCEFLLIQQPDDEDDGKEGNAVTRMAGETDEAFERRKTDARIYRGQLKAIKLTGDPNIPRGEYTFLADDLGEDGLVTTCQKEPFKGSRVVKSRGHIANAGFEDDRYEECQLILISPSRLALYWVGFAHISFFERVNIDKFTAIQ